MINISKTNNIPACLVATGDHKCCVIQVHDEFLGKCYICENKGLTDIETDHFDPNSSMRLDWYNLFYSCGHCNGIKSNKYIGMLKCTDFDVIITDVIKFDIQPIPKELPTFKALRRTKKVKVTVELLKQVHNPTTFTRKLEASNLNNSISKELLKFTNKLNKFYEANSPVKKARIKNELHDLLHISSKFLAFKIWLIKSNAERLNDFNDILPTF